MLPKDLRRGVVDMRGGVSVVTQARIQDVTSAPPQRVWSRRSLAAWLAPGRHLRRSWLLSLPLGSLLAVEAQPLAIPGALGDVSFLDQEEWVEAVSRRRQALATAPQAVSVIDYGAEYALAPWTVPDRLRYEAGIDVYQRRHGQFDVGVRGFNAHGSTRTLVLLDDLVVNHEELGQVPWLPYVHPSDVDRIEIVKGPSSVTYGANAFGGVIALTGRRVADVHEVRSYWDVGTDGLLDIDATAFGPLRINGDGRSWYKFSAGYSGRDDLDGTRGVTPEAHPYAEQSGATDLAAGRATALAGIVLTDGWELRTDLRYIEVFSSDNIEDFSPGSNYIEKIDLIAGLRLEAPWGDLRWIHTWSEQFYSNQRATFDPGVHDAELYKYTQLSLEGESDDVRLDVDEVVSGHGLSVGTEMRLWRSRSDLWLRQGDADSRPENSYENYAVFAEDQWQALPWLTLSAGARYDEHSIVGGNTSPRAAINVRLSDHQFVRASYSSGYRLPNSFELFMDEWFYTVDRERIEVEKIQSVDIGWTARFPEIASRLSLGAFYSRVRDPLTFMPLDPETVRQNYIDWYLAGDASIPPGPFFEYRNIDNDITVYGCEAEWRSRIWREQVELWGALTYQHYEWDEHFVYYSEGFTDPDGNTVLAYDYDLGQRDAPPEWKCALGASGDWRGWFGSIAGRYVDQQEYFAFSATYWNQGEGVAISRRPDYIACDLALGYHWGRIDGYRRFLRLSVLDVFDSAHYEAYESPREVLIDDNEYQWSSEIGRQIALVFSWEF